MFKNREDAGKRLGEALDYYKKPGVLVLAIPRGGVEVGYHVARRLDAEFSILISRKLPYPDNPEAGFGALAEDGSAVILKEASQWVPEKKMKEVTENQIHEIDRRIKVLRKGKPLPEISGRTVILVDDGLAMGSTMRAAVDLCRKRNAAKIVVAVPVAGGRVARDIDKMVDETVILEVPRFFQAVAQVYLNWHDVSDEEVLGIMRKWDSEKNRNAVPEKKEDGME